jgi:hypothetical protein
MNSEKIKQGITINKKSEILSNNCRLFDKFLELAMFNFPSLRANVAFMPLRFYKEILNFLAILRKPIYLNKLVSTISTRRN